MSAVMYEAINTTPAAADAPRVCRRPSVIDGRVPHRALARDLSPTRYLTYAYNLQNLQSLQRYEALSR